MKCYTLSAVILLILFALSSSSESDLIVQTLHGPVRGTTLTSARSHRPFLAFMGIPYAKPPLGDLRFKALQPVDSWTEVRNATVEGSKCPQIPQTREHASGGGEEDCLFINVYTPKLPSGPNDTLHDVLVLIHGGAFYHGSSSRNSLGPDFIVDEDVLMVSFNYRLGILGFLSLQNSEVPGNNGLKDQVVALRWVHQNIALFGGDPNKVTISGNSAGASSVHYHLVSPMSRGLFHRAILQSGCVLSPWAFKTPDRNLRLAFRIGQLLGVNTTDKEVLLQHLKTIPSEQLVSVVRSELRVKPTTDLASTTEDVFLPAKPTDLVNAGNFSKVPLLIGVTSREGILKIQSIRQEAGQDPQSKIEGLMSEEFDMEEGSERLREAAASIKQYYFGDSTNDTVLSHVNLVSDVWFTRGVHCTIKKQVAFSTTPVYAYRFSFSGAMNFYKHRLGGSDIPGAAHADELAYLFRRSSINHTFTPESPELEASTRMVKLWINFVKTGNPTPEVDPLLQSITWSPVTQTEFPYLNIDTNLTLKHNPLNDTMNFWDQLTRNYTTHSLCG